MLAFTGCYVAADFASFRLIDRCAAQRVQQPRLRRSRVFDTDGCKTRFSIFTRMGSGDAAETNASTFLLECRELSHLLSHATASSLVIIDELGRATSTTDGFAIAFAASEHLLSAGAFTLCATHMERLCDLGALYAGSKHCHLRVVTSNDRVQYLHELTEVVASGKVRLLAVSTSPDALRAGVDGAHALWSRARAQRRPSCLCAGQRN